MDNVLYNAMYKFWLDDCPCNSRVVRCLAKRLQALRVGTFEELCGKSEEEISTLPYVGPETMNFLKRFMHHQYLTFNGVSLQVKGV